MKTLRLLEQVMIFLQVSLASCGSSLLQCEFGLVSCWYLSRDGLIDCGGFVLLGTLAESESFVLTSSFLVLTRDVDDKMVWPSPLDFGQVMAFVFARDLTG
ncbi:unnamed protein product [Cochlearia groenlandica]